MKWPIVLHNTKYVISRHPTVQMLICLDNDATPIYTWFHGFSKLVIMSDHCRWPRMSTQLLASSFGMASVFQTPGCAANTQVLVYFLLHVCDRVHCNAQLYGLAITVLTVPLVWTELEISRDCRRQKISKLFCPVSKCGEDNWKQSRFVTNSVHNTDKTRQNCLVCVGNVN